MNGLRRLATPFYSRAGHLWGWAIAAAYLVHSVLTINLPRTDKALALRETLRGWHYLVGTLLFVLVVLRLVAWVRERRAVRPPEGLPAGLFLWGRGLALASYGLLLVAPVFGLLYGWSSQLALRLGPVPLPPLVEGGRALWQFSGYVHSGLGFMLLVLNLAALVTAGASALIFRHGLIRALPPGYGAMALIGMSTSVWAFATFRSNDPGPAALAVFWGLVAAVWGLSRLRRPTARPAAPVSPAARALVPLGVTALVAGGFMGPYWLFRVTPLPSGAVAEAAVDGRDWHAEQVVDVVLPSPEEIARARAIGQETYKWCTFCHAMEPGKPPLVGPNLHNLWGQAAGGVPGFPYSGAMARARAAGLRWDDETIAAYIADPDGFMPGTSMIISSGPVTDPEVRAAVVTLLKAETMAGVAAPQAPQVP